MSVSGIGSCSQAQVPQSSSAPAGCAPLEGGTALLPASQNVDIGEAVARMVIENAFARRQLAREVRASAAVAQEAAQKAQVEHMREQAEASYDAGMREAQGKVVSGLGGIAGAALGFAGAMWSNRGLVAAGDAAKPLGDGASGVFDMEAHGFRRTADRLGAQVKADEMRAEAEKKRLDGADDDIAETRDAVRSALDFLREFQSTRAKSQTAAASIRG